MFYYIFLVLIIFPLFNFLCCKEKLVKIKIQGAVVVTETYLRMYQRTEFLGKIKVPNFTVVMGVSFIYP